VEQPRQRLHGVVRLHESKHVFERVVMARLYGHGAMDQDGQAFQIGGLYINVKGSEGMVEDGHQPVQASFMHDVRLLLMPGRQIELL
jgi:hypothetical protein